MATQFSSTTLAAESFISPIPPGIRVVVAVPDEQHRAAILGELHGRPSLVVVGETGLWSECEGIIADYVPEILIATSTLIPPDFPGEGLRWPIVLMIGAANPGRRAHTIPFFREESFCAALEGSIQRVFSAKLAELNALTQSYISALRPRTPAGFTVMDGGRERTIPNEDVKFITMDGNYAKLHTDAGQFRIRETLNSLANALDRDQFARIHRSIIVNMSFVERILTTADHGSAVVLRDRTHLPIGRSFSIPSSLKR